MITMNDNSEKIVTEYDFDLTMIGNFFQRFHRQGPGSDRDTLRALEFVKSFLPSHPRVADIGCGTGGPTVTLARALDGCSITAIELLTPMMEGLKRHIAQEGLEERITPMQLSMEELPFEEKSYDLLWAEGSIYHIGYEKGLREWRRFLKPGGCIAITECCWLSQGKPANSRWITENFVEIDTIPNKLHTFAMCGYRPVALFVLPSDCWTQNYYTPIERGMEEFLQEYDADARAQLFIERMKEEIEAYHRWKEYYGYVFFVGQKAND